GAVRTVSVTMNIDEYDAQHRETGSSNISKATLEWSALLWAARAAKLASNDPRPVLHIAYEMINEHCRGKGSKCGNCGSPYRLDNGVASGEDACSEQCFNEFVASL